MKLVVQRVKEANVTRVIDNKLVGKIDLGLFVLVGFAKGDSEKDVKLLTDKLAKLRVMNDGNDKMNFSVNEVNGKILVVSQFTLYANTSGGNRPSFIDAEEPSKAQELYEFFISELRKNNVQVETGSFGDYMKIDAQLDGPVTIIYET